jgi:aldose 1-epimerase
MFRLTFILLFTAIAAATSNGSVFPHFSGDPYERYTISANGINATFMPYGARLTNLVVNDKAGMPRDVVSTYTNGQQDNSNHVVVTWSFKWIELPFVPDPFLS